MFLALSLDKVRMAETSVQCIQCNAAPSGVLFVLKLAMMGSITYGVLRSAWGLGDIGLGFMAWLNIVAITILPRPVLAALRDYEKQKSAGLDPQFDPDKVRVRKAEFWKERRAGWAPARGSDLPETSR